jgi:hypothetical protein
VDEPFTSALRSAMHQSPSAVMGLALEQSFLAAGKEGPAINLQNINHQVLQEIDARFDSVSEEVSAAQQELYTYLEEFGPTMTPEQQQKAIDNHMKANQELYARWEKLGGAMSTSMTALGTLGAAGEDHPYAGRAFEMTESLPQLGTWTRRTAGATRWPRCWSPRRRAARPSWSRPATSRAPGASSTS